MVKCICACCEDDHERTFEASAIKFLERWELNHARSLVCIKIH